MILNIPLKKTPNQTLSFSANNDYYQLELNTRLGELYLSVIKNSEPVIYNRICQNKNPISGGFVFIDVNGESDPLFKDLGDRFKLIWTDQS